VRIKLTGPVDDVTGYAEIARQAALALDRLGAQVYIKPQNWGCTRVELPEKAKDRLERLKGDWRKPDTFFDVFFYLSVPPAFRKIPGKPCVGYTMSEVDGLSPLWVEYCNTVDRVLVPSTFNLRTFAASGVKEEKLRLVPLGIDKELFNSQAAPYPLPGTEGLFKFLSVGEWGPRKGFDLLLAAFVQEFSRQDDVCLILKCHRNGSDYDPAGNQILKEIKALTARVKKNDAPRIFLIPRTISSEDMPRLYRMADCFVLATRGEGWCMPVFEALACGTPVIATNWSAYLDYLRDENAYLIEVQRLETIPPLGTPDDELYVGHHWALPSIEHLRQLLRRVYHNPQEAREKALKGQRLVHTQLSWNKCGEKILQCLKEQV